MQQKAKNQIHCQTKGDGLRYLLYLPPSDETATEVLWPVILYLHGIGERGDNLNSLLSHGIPKIVESSEVFPFITVSPQCPSDTFWVEQYLALKITLDEVMTKYRVDGNRIYLTGNSMGGYGVWGLAIHFPKTFAAITPICGGGQTEEICVLKEVPVWAFHGEVDEVIPLEQGRRMTEALEACGGLVRFTVYPGVGHDSWTRTYENPELYQWFLRHSRI